MVQYIQSVLEHSCSTIYLFIGDKQKCLILIDITPAGLYFAPQRHNFLITLHTQVEQSSSTMIKQVVFILSISLLASVRADGCSGQAKIGSQADLDALSSCRSYSGTISVDTSTAQTLQLNGLQTLNGDLVLKNNDNLSGFNAPALQSINGQLEIANQTRLSSFVIPKLQSAQGISMAILPQLANVSFLNTVSGLKKLSLTDTGAEKIQNPNVMALEQLTISNNNNLISIQFPSLSKVDGDVYITANGASCNVEVTCVSTKRIHGICLQANFDCLVRL